MATFTDLRIDGDLCHQCINLKNDIYERININSQKYLIRGAFLVDAEQPLAIPPLEIQTQNWNVI